MDSELTKQMKARTKALQDSIQRDLDENAELREQLAQALEEIEAATKLRNIIMGCHNAAEEENAKLRGDLAQACKRMLVYTALHSQSHPNYNGNRFDDEVWAVEKMKEAETP